MNFSDKTYLNAKNIHKKDAVVSDFVLKKIATSKFYASKDFGS